MCQRFSSCFANTTLPPQLLCCYYDSRWIILFKRNFIFTFRFNDFILSHFTFWNWIERTDLNIIVLAERWKCVFHTSSFLFQLRFPRSKSTCFTDNNHLDMSRVEEKKRQKNVQILMNVKTRPVLDRFHDSGMEMLGVQLRWKAKTCESSMYKLFLKLRKCTKAC